MTSRSPFAAPAASATDDYTYEMTVRASREKIIEAVTDDTEISRWWTAVTSSEKVGSDVRLFRDGAPFVCFTVEHTPGTPEVAWSVTECAAAEDWVGTRPSFSVRENVDGTRTVAFRHVGLDPSVECFEQCRAGWNHFMSSLQQYLETGVGRPNQPRDPSA